MRRLHMRWRRGDGVGYTFRENIRGLHAVRDTRQTALLNNLGKNFIPKERTLSPLDNRTRITLGGHSTVTDFARFLG